jgi:N-acetylmuramoyl-L-alanine amidase
VPKPTYEFIPSPNYAKRTKPISAIVIHYTASMGIEGTIDWFKRRESQVSAHYVIGRDGRVVQMVRDEDVAWHAGRSLLGTEPNVNSFSIGIELVGTADSGFTDTQMASLYSLLELLVVKYRVRPERVVGHGTICPGRKIDPDGYNKQFNWARTLEIAQRSFSVLGPDTGVRNA